MAASARARSRAPARAASASGGVGVAAVATMCNLSARHVQRLVQEGVIPRASRGRYNLAASVRAYIAYLQQRLEQLQAELTLRPTDPGVASARTQKLEAEARLAELRLRRAEGNLIDVETAAAEFRRYQEALRDVLLAVRSRYADRIPAAQLQELISGLLEDLRRGTDDVLGLQVPPSLSKGAESPPRHGK